MSAHDTAGTPVPAETAAAVDVASADDGDLRGSRLRALVAVATGRRASSLGILVLFLVIFVTFAVTAPAGTFLARSNIEAMALSASQVLLLGAGMTYVLIVAGIDLSVGAMLVFAAVTAAKIVAGYDDAGLLAVVLVAAAAAVAAGMLWGVVNGLLIVRTGIPAFIGTLGTSTVILGLAQVWTGGINVSGVPIRLQEVFGIGKLGGQVPYPVIVTVVIVAVLWVVLAKTRYGMRLYAIGANPEAARRSGINVGGYIVSVYALMGALAGVAAFVDVSRFTTATVSGYTSTALNAITAAAIGGTSFWGGRGSIGGTVIGSLVPATLTSGFVVVGFQPFWQNVAVGSVLVLAVSLDQARRRRLAGS